MLAGLDFEFIHNLLYVGNFLGEFFGFFLLFAGFHTAAKNKGPVLCTGMDALVVESLVRLDCGLEVIFNSAVKVGGDRGHLALVTGRSNADFIGDCVVGRRLPGQVLCLCLSIVGVDVAGKRHDAFIAILRDAYVAEVVAVEGIGHGRFFIGVIRVHVAAADGAGGSEHGRGGKSYRLVYDGVSHIIYLQVLKEWLESYLTSPTALGMLED